VLDALVALGVFIVLLGAVGGLTLSLLLPRLVLQIALGVLLRDLVVGTFKLFGWFFSALLGVVWPRNGKRGRQRRRRQRRW
jgi:hypothetical protein